jgi:hypothetical protein
MHTQVVAISDSTTRSIYSNTLSTVTVLLNKVTNGEAQLRCSCCCCCCFCPNYMMAGGVGPSIVVVVVMGPTTSTAVSMGSDSGGDGVGDGAVIGGGSKPLTIL